MVSIEIDKHGDVYCNGELCFAIVHGTTMCAGCALAKVFEKMYSNCDPLECRKIKCAGCEYRLNAE